MTDATDPSVGWEAVSAGALCGVALVDGDTVVRANDTFARAFGLDGADAAVGASWRDRYVDRERTRLADTVLPRVRDGERWRGTATGRRPDGAAVDHELAITRVGDGRLLWSVAGARAAGRPAGDPRRTPDERFVRAVLDAVDDVVYVIDEDGEARLWNEALVETTGYSHEEIDAMEPMELVPPDQHEYVPGLLDAIDAIEDRRVDVDVLTKDGRRITHEFTGTTFEDPETGRSYRCGVARDVTERRERERRLERRRDELATLDSINELLLETVRELVQTSSREAVERRICERLAASDLYRFAWIGAQELGGERIEPRVRAGDPDGYLDEVTITADGSETGRGPAGRAMDTGDVQVAAVEDESFAPWRDAAVERGLRTVAAVPLHHEGTVYGVLVVYATREDAFTEREQAGFDVLGRTVGYVIHATRNRDLLFADAVVELEFRVADAESPLVRTAADLECELSLDGYVASDDRWIAYLSVEGAAPAAVIAAATGDPAVEDGRVIAETDAGGRVELVLSESSLLATAAHAGASVRETGLSPDDGRVTVEAPADADVRDVVEVLREAYPGAELLATRERDREVSTVGRPDGLLDDLTDRQREALLAAFRAGYFDWPRASTAAEVADSLGITPATLHGHLRKAETAILSAVLDRE